MKTKEQKILLSLGFVATEQSVYVLKKWTALISVHFGNDQIDLVTGVVCSSAPQGILSRVENTSARTLSDVMAMITDTFHIAGALAAKANMRDALGL